MTEATRTAGQRVLFNEQRLRSGWRILIFLALFAVFVIVGWLMFSLLPAAAVFWLSPAVLLIAALAAGWILIARLDGRPIGALGFAVLPSTSRELGLGLVWGSGLIAAVALLLLLSGSVVWVADSGGVAEYLSLMVGSLVFFAVAAAWEEAFFRGYAFQVLVEGIGAWPAVLGSGILFALAHRANPEVTVLALVNIFLASVWLSLAYLRTRSLWFPTAMHTGWNWAMAFLLDLPVSGLGAFDTPIYGTVDAGPAWWTGGEFGPEGGIACTLVLVAATAWIWRTRALGEASEMRALGPIVDRRLEPAAP